MTDADTPAPAPPSTRPFWIGLTLGTPFVLVGIHGVLANARDTHPAELARWIGGSAIVHDAVALPLVSAVALAGRRWLPAWSWPAIRWGLFVTAVLLLVSRPFVGRYGNSPGNLTVLDRDYGGGVAIALGLVWVGVGLWAAFDRRALRRAVSGRT